MHPDPQADTGPAVEQQLLEHCRLQLGTWTDSLRRVHQRALSEPAAAGREAEDLALELVDRLRPEGSLILRMVPVPHVDLAVHSMNVCVLAVTLGQTLGWTRTELAATALGALWHDVGRLVCAAAECHASMSHVTEGERVGRAMGLSEGVLEIIGSHHDRVGLGGSYAQRSADLSAAARLVALADRFDDLCHPWDGGEGTPPHEAMTVLMQREISGQGCGLLAAFVDVLGIYPLGSPVELTDGRHALVMRSSWKGRREVRVYLLGGRRVPDSSEPLDLQRGGMLRMRRAVRLGELPLAARGSLPGRWRSAYFWES